MPALLMREQADMAMIGRRDPFDFLRAMGVPSPGLSSALFKPPNPNLDVPPVDRANPPIPAPLQGGEPQRKVNWAGVIADALAGLAGQPGQFAPMQERRRQEQTALERGEQQYRRQRADALSDDERNYNQQLALKQWDRDHPNDELARIMDAAGIPPDKRPGLYAQALERKINPPRTVVMADGTVMEVPSGPMAPPAAPVGPLTPIKGGPAPGAPGGFPPYYR